MEKQVLGILKRAEEILQRPHVTWGKQHMVAAGLGTYDAHHIVEAFRPGSGNDLPAFMSGTYDWEMPCSVSLMGALYVAAAELAYDDFRPDALAESALLRVAAWLLEQGVYDHAPGRWRTKNCLAVYWDQVFATSGEDVMETLQGTYLSLA